MADFSPIESVEVEKRGHSSFDQQSRRTDHASHNVGKRAMRGAPAPPLLWVNKDAGSKSLSRSEGHTATLIQIHAQRTTANAIRRNRVEVLRAAASSARRLVQQVHVAKGAREVSEEDESTSVGSEDPIQHVRLYRANFRRGDSLDPFSAFSTPFDNATYTILQFYTSLSIPATLDDVVATLQQVQSRSPSPKPPADMHDSLNVSDLLPATRSPMLKASLLDHLHMPYMLTLPLSTILSASMFDPLHMSCLLTATAATMGLSETPTAGISVGYYMGPAIQLMRTFLQSGMDKLVITPQLVLDIIFLAIAECHRKAYSAALTHLRVVLRLTDRLNLSSELDAYVYQLARDTDGIVAAETKSQAALPLQRPGVPDLLRGVRQLGQEGAEYLLRRHAGGRCHTRRQADPRSSSSAPALLTKSLDPSVHATLRQLVELMYAERYGHTSPAAADHLDRLNLIHPPLLPHLHLHLRPP